MADDPNPLANLTRGRGWASAKAALTLGRVAARGVTGASATEAARALGSQLDEMKGLAMKIGQILSYLDTPLPDELREQLGRLQTGAVHRPWPEVAAQIEAELGIPVERAFDHVAPEPIAAASIGQVHRAIHQGHAVAVKVRYPGIEESFAGDTQGLRRVARLASLATAVDGQGIVDELAARLAEECDYEREARAQRAFARAFAADPLISIPDVIDDRSSAGLLTTTWSDGIGFEAFSTSPQSERDRAAVILVRMAFESFLLHAAIQADPHPGNYLFEEDDRVTFLDFGCVRLFEPSFVEAHRHLLRCVMEERRDDFDEALVATGMVGKPRRFDFDYEWRVQRHTWAPFVTSDFRFTRDFVRRGTELYGPHNPNARSMSLPPPAIWLQRLVWGLWAVLGRLQAQGDFAAEARRCLDRPLRPLTLTPVDEGPAE